MVVRDGVRVSSGLSFHKFVPFEFRNRFDQVRCSSRSQILPFGIRKFVQQLSFNQFPYEKSLFLRGRLFSCFFLGFVDTLTDQLLCGVCSQFLKVDFLKADELTLLHLPQKRYLRIFDRRFIHEPFDFRMAGNNLHSASDC